MLVKERGDGDKDSVEEEDEDGEEEGEEEDEDDEVKTELIPVTEVVLSHPPLGRTVSWWRR